MTKEDAIKDLKAKTYDMIVKLLNSDAPDLAKTITLRSAIITTETTIGAIKARDDIRRKGEGVTINKGTDNVNITIGGTK